MTFSIHSIDLATLKPTNSATMHLVAIDSLPLYGDLRHTQYLVPGTIVTMNNGRRYAQLRPETKWIEC